jgi:hypothetical protein
MKPSTAVSSRTSSSFRRRRLTFRPTSSLWANSSARWSKPNRTLSSPQTARLEIESFEGSIGFSDVLTCTNFVRINIGLFRKTLKPVEWAFQDSASRRRTFRI